MQVVIDSLMTNYSRIGKGPVLLLLHGWGDNSKTFAPLAKSLAEEYTVVLLDLPGFGGTQVPESAWGLDEYSNFVAEFTNKIGLKEVYAMVGHSNGGAIAIRSIASSQVKPKKLVLLASSGVRDVCKGRKRAARIAAKGAKLATYPLPSGVKSRLKKKVYKTIGSDLFVAEHMQETFKKIITDDVVVDTRDIKIPTLLIYGDKDEQTPVRYGEMLAANMPNGRLEILTGLTHFLHVEEPEKITSMIKEFVE